MCGIFGIVCKEEKTLGTILTEAAQKLSYRGYDSVGAATIKADGTIDLRKDVGKVDAVSSRLHFSDMVGQRGITQLRWATFGVPSQINAQPHLDSEGHMVGAHNGNVVNNVELRQQFMAEGMIVRSMNDGESCVHAVERHIGKTGDYVQAIRQAYEDLMGDYSFVIGPARDTKLYAIKKGSGLVVGIGDGFTCISSDLPSILPLTRKVLRIEDGEIITLWPDRVELHSAKDGSLIEREIEKITETMDSVQKGGYPHFMLKEIYEQPRVAGELLHLLEGSPDIEPILQALRQARHVYFIGCGTSYHACMLGAFYFSRLANCQAFPVLAPQFVSQYASALQPDDVGIFVSQSGETKDVVNAVQAAINKKMRTFGLVNVIGSTLTRLTERWLPLTCGYEISVPATKTFTNQAIAFLYLALRLGNRKVQELSGLPKRMEQTLAIVAPQVEPLATSLSKRNDLYCLGYGSTYGIALEGALKLKEITYAHCEGMLSTEFKHGPLSAVNNGYPVLFVAGSEDTAVIISGINEVTCRGGLAIAIAEENSQLRANASSMVILPPVGFELNPILAVLPLQLLSYNMSVGRGYDPDFPRNLSKTLTVD